MNEKLTVQDLVRSSAERLGLNKAEADTFIKEFFQLIADALAEEKYVKIKGLGTFKLIEVDSRQSVNVNTGERFEIQGHTKISFTPDPTLRDVINRPFAHFETVLLQNEELLKSTEIEIEGNEIEPVEEPEVENASVEENKERTQTSSALNVESSLNERSVEPQKEEKQEDSKEESALVIQEDLVVNQKEFDVDKPVVEPAEKEGPQEQAALAEEAERKRTMKYFIGIVVLVCLLCVGILAFIYFPSLTRALYGLKEPDIQKVDTTEQVLPAIQQVDTSAVQPVVQPMMQEVKEIISEQPTTEQQKPVKREEPFMPDETSYEIIGTQESYTIHEGETLTRVALRFWGSKAFWPYLVKHNPTVITNPDNVPYGTTIQIPKLKKK